MAEFSTFDGSQGKPVASWWNTRSKKAPIGPGMNKAYSAMVSALEKYDDDMCYETAKHALSKTEDLKNHAKKLPLIKSGVKKNDGFFLALDNSIGQLEKSSMKLKGDSQAAKIGADTISGKGNDGDDRAGHFFTK